MQVVATLRILNENDGEEETIYMKKIVANSFSDAAVKLKIMISNKINNKNIRIILTLYMEPPRKNAQHNSDVESRYISIISDSAFDVINDAAGLISYITPLLPATVTPLRPVPALGYLLNTLNSPYIDIINIDEIVKQSYAIIARGRPAKFTLRVVAAAPALIAGLAAQLCSTAAVAASLLPKGTRYYQMLWEAAGCNVKSVAAGYNSYLNPVIMFNVEVGGYEFLVTVDPALMLARAAAQLPEDTVEALGNNSSTMSRILEMASMPFEALLPVLPEIARMRGGLMVYGAPDTLHDDRAYMSAGVVVPLAHIKPANGGNLELVVEAVHRAVDIVAGAAHEAASKLRKSGILAGVDAEIQLPLGLDEKRWPGNVRAIEKLLRNASCKFKDSNNSTIVCTGTPLIDLYVIHKYLATLIKTINKINTVLYNKIFNGKTSLVGMRDKLQIHTPNTSTNTLTIEHTAPTPENVDQIIRFLVTAANDALLNAVKNLHNYQDLLAAGAIPYPFMFKHTTSIYTQFKNKNNIIRHNTRKIVNNNYLIYVYNTSDKDEIMDGTRKVNDKSINQALTALEYAAIKLGTMLAAVLSKENIAAIGSLVAPYMTLSISGPSYTATISIDYYNWWAPRWKRRMRVHYYAAPTTTAFAAMGSIDMNPIDSTYAENSKEDKVSYIWIVKLAAIGLSVLPSDQLEKTIPAIIAFTAKKLNDITAKLANQKKSLIRGGEKTRRKTRNYSSYI